MQIEFHVCPGDKGEKKYSRRYQPAEILTTDDGRVVAQKETPLQDIYVMRPWSNGKDKLIVTIEEK